MIYVHVPYSTEKDSSEGYDRLKSSVSDQMTNGRTCSVADVRHTDRWTGANPTACCGDLAFYCNSPEITKELVKWAKKSGDGD